MTTPQSSAMMRVFLQARMSSARFPGKMLAPFRGQPLIRHVIAAIERALPDASMILTTSDDPTDDPLARYVETLGVTVFRGSLDDVFERFRRCVAAYPCEWILRLSGDSPLLDAGVLHAAASFVGDARYDLVTTIFPRTFPKGHNAELIRVSTFMALDPQALTPDDREHVTPFFYRNAGRFRIHNIDSGNPRLAKLRLAVDTMDDLLRLARVSGEELPTFSPHALLQQR